MVQQRVLIVKQYYQNDESWVATIRKSVPNASTVKRLFE